LARVLLYVSPSDGVNESVGRGRPRRQRWQHRSASQVENLERVGAVIPLRTIRGRTKRHGRAAAGSVQETAKTEWARNRSHRLRIRTRRRTTPTRGAERPDWKRYRPTTALARESKALNPRAFRWRRRLQSGRFNGQRARTAETPNGSRADMTPEGETSSR